MVQMLPTNPSRTGGGASTVLAGMHTCTWERLLQQHLCTCILNFYTLCHIMQVQLVDTTIGALLLDVTKYVVEASFCL